jgi:DtxR family Mn-dependent transcriptional regulator
MTAEENPISHQAEEYLEAIYRLEKKRGYAKTMELARKLEVVPGSVTNTIEGLERRGLVIHKPYKGVKLTDKGRRIAANVLRKHRLAERLLTDILHLDWSEAHDAACKLEHAISPEIINPLENALGHPKTCPHGNPIPTNNGSIAEEESKPLTDLNSGEGGVVVKIADEKTNTLKILDSLGLTPGSYVEVEGKRSFTGPLDIHVEGKHHTVEQTVATHVHVKPVNTHGGGTKRA